MAESSLDMRVIASLVIGVCVLVAMIAVGVGLTTWGHRLLGRGESLGAWGRGLGATGLMLYLCSLAGGMIWSTISTGVSPGMMALNLGGCGLTLFAYAAALITLLVGESRLGARSPSGRG